MFLPIYFPFSPFCSANNFLAALFISWDLFCPCGAEYAYPVTPPAEWAAGLSGLTCMCMLYSVGVVQRTPCKRNPNTDDPWDGESKAQPGKHQLGKHSIQYLKDFLPPFLPLSFFPSSFFILPPFAQGWRETETQGGGGRSPSPSLHLTPSFLPPFLSFLPPPFLFLSFSLFSSPLLTFDLVLTSFFFLQVLYSDSFRKQVQGKAAYVLDTPEMRRVRETQKHISTVRALLCRSVT